METTKKITGCIGDKKVSRYILNYQQNQPEEILTTKREICDEFELLGYNREQVIFIND